MTKKLIIFAVMFLTLFFWLPSADSGSASAQNKGRHSGNYYGGRRHRGHRKYTYGYKNYGQYRRTQVGNRRFRTVRRYYWRDGIRLSRYIRVYY